MKLVSVRTIDKVRSDNIYDCLIVACGYESRSLKVAGSIGNSAKRKKCFGFKAQKQLSYDDSYAWFKDHGFDISECSDAEFREVLDVFLLACLKDNIENVAIDISCFNRLRLAHIVDALRTAEYRRLSVSFFYAIAEYSPPPLDLVPCAVAEPVIPQFSGWTVQPDKPSAALIGLGYEPNKAIGVIDHLELNHAVWTYIANSPISEYEGGVEDANSSLLKIMSDEGKKIYYDLLDPAGTYHEMNALVDALKQNYNPIIVPFGPKIFALLSLLIACIHDEVGVWRVSGGALEVPVDRRPSDYVVCLETVFEYV